MKRWAIPTVTDADAQRALFFRAVKHLLDRLTGQTAIAAPLKPLDRDATLPEVIDRVNEVIRRLEGDE